jgi:hypothetical protein
VHPSRPWARSDPVARQDPVRPWRRYRRCRLSRPAAQWDPARQCPGRALSAGCACGARGARCAGITRVALETLRALRPGRAGRADRALRSGRSGRARGASIALRALRAGGARCASRAGSTGITGCRLQTLGAPAAQLPRPDPERRLRLWRQRARITGVALETLRPCGPVAPLGRSGPEARRVRSRPLHRLRLCRLYRPGP